jgi:peptidoglycan/LPS O-acetylase OafA/YrhL
MKLSYILEKKNNNLDLFRVIAAFMVIYGHAYAILPAKGKSDFLGQLLGFDYSGSLAVKIFFFLSGLVVTNSLLDKRGITQFLINRAFRIWPAFLLVLAISAFFLGPLLTLNSFRDYFSSPLVYDYFFRGAIMDIRSDLPGVFQNNTYKAVNGSLWTIPWEVKAYLFLLAAFFLKILNFKKIAILFFLLVIAAPFLRESLHLIVISKNPEVYLLWPCFAIGSIFSVYKKDLPINLLGVFLLWIMYYLLKSNTFSFYIFYLALFYSIIFISSRTWFLMLKPRFDISYGVYLWGWPIQQILAQYYSDFGILFNQIWSILIASVLGLISWKLLEDPAIKMGRNFGNNLFKSNNID